MAEHDRYYGLSKKLADELRYYEIHYFKEDLPVPFCGLFIYPATVHDYESFSSCSTCLTLDKSKDPKGVMKTHLEYLIDKMQAPGEEGAEWSYKVQRLFEIIFHIRNGIKCRKCGNVVGYDSPEFQKFIADVQEAGEKGEETPQFICPVDGCGGTEHIQMIKVLQDPDTKKFSLSVDDKIITAEDFVRLRQIVLYQNFSDYEDDSYVDPAIKADYEEKQRLERANNDTHATLEKKVVCLAIYTGWEISKIFDMSVRKFTLALSTVDDLINYKITKQALMGGFASLPKGQKLEHWIYKPDKDLYGDAYKTLDEVKEQVSVL